MTIDDSLSLNLNRCHYPLITYLRRNTKKLKCWVFVNNKRFLFKLFQKKAKITILFFMKNSNNNNIILGLWVLVFSFMYLVSVYPTNRTLKLLLNKKSSNWHPLANRAAYHACSIFTRRERKITAKQHKLSRIKVNTALVFWCILFY